MILKLNQTHLQPEFEDQESQCISIEHFQPNIQTIIKIINGHPRGFVEYIDSVTGSRFHILNKKKKCQKRKVHWGGRTSPVGKMICGAITPTFALKPEVVTCGSCRRILVGQGISPDRFPA